jgi:hypothetical protein
MPKKPKNPKNPKKPKKKAPRGKRRLPRQRANRTIDYAQSKGIPTVRIDSKKAFREMGSSEKEQAEILRRPLTQGDLSNIAIYEGMPKRHITRGDRRNLDDLKARTFYSRDGAERAQRQEAIRQDMIHAQRARDAGRQQTPGTPATTPGSTPRPQSSARRATALAQMIGGGSPAVIMGNLFGTPPPAPRGTPPTPSRQGPWSRFHLSNALTP